jgi:ferrous iron transport protein A
MEHQLTLDRIPENQEVKVVRILGGWGIRQRLNQMGIHPGDTILVKRSAIMGGPILIRVHGADVALGRGMTRKVIVQEI